MYKNKEDIAKCSRRHYEKNRDKIKRKVAEKKEEMKEFIRSLKVKPCTDCGILYPYYVMDFDHIGTDKLMVISRMWGHSKKKILAEVAKCELVCSNCHRERTHKRTFD